MRSTMNDETLDVFLDTEILRRDPFRRRGAFAALKHLVSAGSIRLHLSEITVREFTSSQQAEADAAVRAAESALRRAQLYAAQASAEKLDVAAKALVDIGADAADTLRSALDDWCASHGVQIHPVHESHGQKVVGAYFAGSAPFRKPKERTDFPDAFIFQALSDLASSRPKVVFVSGDPRFAEACRDALPAVAVFATLEELLGLPNLSNYLREHILDEQFEKVADRLPLAIGKSGEIPTQVTTALIGRRVIIHFPVTGVATVEHVEHVPVVSVGGDIIYFGGGMITMPFSMRAVTDLVLVASVEALDEARVEAHALIRRRENSTAEVVLKRTLVGSGTLLIGIDPAVLETQVPDNELNDALEKAEVVLESLSIYGEGSGAIETNVVLEHAVDEAYRQLEAGDLATSLNEAEELERLSRARWVNVPPQFQGKHGNIIITDQTQFRIAPLLRFENLVKIFKQSILEEQKKEENGEPEET